MKARKFLKAVFVAGIAFLLLQSCCKIYCGGGVFSIRFINYNVADIDTVLFTKYVANGNFDQKIDSVFVYAHTNQADTIYSGFSEKVEFDKDWKVKLISTGREYNITDIKTTSEKCTCGNSTYQVIKSYKLDGVIQPTFYIDLRK